MNKERWFNNFWPWLYLLPSWKDQNSAKPIYFFSFSAPCISNNPCLNGGLCNADSGRDAGYYCTCPRGFLGYNCEEGKYLQRHWIISEIFFSWPNFIYHVKSCKKWMLIYKYRKKITNSFWKWRNHPFLLSIHKMGMRLICFSCCCLRHGHSKPKCPNLRNVQLVFVSV